MAISITNNHKFFNNKSNALILFKDFDNDPYFETIIKDDFILIFSKEKIVGINIINYKKYFNLEEGYHLLSIENKNYLLERFSEYLSEQDFEPFFQIGKVIQIENHQYSNKLKVLKVLFKNQIEKQIITNATSINKDQNYLFATNGSITFNGTKILNTEVMKIKSEGMIISYNTIGIPKDGLVDCNNLSINDVYIF